MAFLFGKNGKTFKPRKDIVEGTHQVQCGQECYENQFCETSVSPLIVNCLSLITDLESSWRCIQHELLRHAAETLGTGNMRQAVALPAGVDLDEWVGKYISESFEWISGYLRRFQSKRTNGLARRGVRSLAQPPSRCTLIASPFVHCSGEHRRFFQPNKHALRHDPRILHRRKMSDHVCQCEIWVQVGRWTTSNKWSHVLPCFLSVLSASVRVFDLFASIHVVRWKGQFSAPPRNT